MLQNAFSEVYAKFKLHFYRQVFAKLGQREATLTTVETFCMEIIHTMKCPTVNEFASFVQISPPNAAYKINSLVQKGYLKKVRSEEDRREFHIEPTDKYFEYYNVSYNYLKKVMDRIEERFLPEEIIKFEEMLVVIGQELMQEVPITINSENITPMGKV